MITKHKIIRRKFMRFLIGANISMLAMFGGKELFIQHTNVQRLPALQEVVDHPVAFPPLRLLANSKTVYVPTGHYDRKGYNRLLTQLAEAK